jgi:CRP/FNR family cyclic AMP-dependent transcriptional regulator
MVSPTLSTSCLTCDSRPDRPFCDMPTEALQDFEEIKSIGYYPKRTVLFAEGRAVRGIYILCDGRARLSIGADNGKSMTLRIAGPGEVLGMGAALSSTPYEVTAEMLDDSQVAFVRRKDLVKFLRNHRSTCMQVVYMLSQDLHGAYERVRNIGAIRPHRPRLLTRPRVIYS